MRISLQLHYPTLQEILPVLGSGFGHRSGCASVFGLLAYERIDGLTEIAAKRENLPPRST